MPWRIVLKPGNDTYDRRFSVCCGKLPGDDCSYSKGDCVWTGRGNQEKECCDDSTQFITVFTSSDAGLYYSVEIYDPQDNPVATCDRVGMYMPCIAGRRNMYLSFSIGMVKGQIRGWFVDVLLNSVDGTGDAFWTVWVPDWRDVRISIPSILTPTHFVLRARKVDSEVVLKVSNLAIEVGGNRYPTTTTISTFSPCWSTVHVLAVNSMKQLHVLGIRVPGLNRKDVEYLYPSE